MKWVFVMAVLVVGAVVFVACGGGGDNGARTADEQAIERVVRSFIAAFEAKDVETMAGLFAQRCGDMRDDLRSVLQQYEDAQVEFEFDVERVAVRDLDGNSAQAAPFGSVTVNGAEQPLGGEEDFVEMVKEAGGWKLADCAFFGG